MEGRRTDCAVSVRRWLRCPGQVRRRLRRHFQLAGALQDVGALAGGPCRNAGLMRLQTLDSFLQGAATLTVNTPAKLTAGWMGQVLEWLECS